ncbi:hypothetical protein [Tardiphaga sp. 619_E2_N8_5]|uniref:hypothetical protein n=1 Tax=unclassified Tardiphaga TaxID=2631404 RepID=UPI003F248A29
MIANNGVEPVVVGKLPRTRMRDGIIKSRDKFGTEMPRLADYVAESTQPENDAATIDRAHCFAT